MRIVSQGSFCVSCAEFAKEICEFSRKEILPLVSEMDKKAEIV